MNKYKIIYSPAAARIEGLVTEVEADGHTAHGGFISFAVSEPSQHRIVLRVASKYVLQIQDVSDS